MPTYISLVNFTGQGIRDVRETTKRLKDFKQIADSMGVDVTAVYYTVGRYDMIVIGNAPDLQAISALALSVGSQGNVRTETLSALSPEEMESVIAKIQ